MKLKKFTRYYGLTLLPASHSQIMLGELVWKPRWGKPKLEYKGMPNHIFNAFYDADLVDIETHERGLKNFKNQEQYPAQLSQRSIKTNLEQALEFSPYEIERLNIAFELKNVQQYQFEDIQVRLLSNAMRVSLDAYLERLRVQNWKAYQGNIKRVYMITELYYGNLQMQIDKRHKRVVEGAIKKIGLQLKSSFDVDNSTSYVFKNNQVPFAMRLERVRTFNG